MQNDPEEITLDCRVDSYRAGWTVVEFLAHRFKYHPVERWTHRVATGRVLVNGRGVTPATVVNKDDLVSYTIVHREPVVDARYDVVYEDDHILAVSKSGNIPVHACGVYIRSTLIVALRERFGDRVSLAHRLDRETSGLVLLSKDTAAARSLGRMFAEGAVAKSYIAIVHGRADEREFRIDAPVAKADEPVAVKGPYDGADGRPSDLAADLPRFVPRREVNFATGKPASTLFEVERYAGDFSVLRATPLTGRTNQIRVHLHHAGHPIVGDKVYRPGDIPAGPPLLERHALHCRTLRFAHPVSGAPMSLRADVPADMQEFIRTRSGGDR